MLARLFSGVLVAKGNLGGMSSRRALSNANLRPESSAISGVGGRRLMVSRR
jgi:hypothetical protein